MRRKYWFMEVALLSVLVSCAQSPDVPPVGSGHAEWVRQDFENLRGWISPDKAASLTTEQAHSGKYAIKTGPNVEYSIGYSLPMSQLSTTKPRKIHVEAWAWVPSAKASTVLVVYIQNGTRTALWQGINLSSKVGRYKKWQKIEADLLLNSDITSDDTLGVNLWGRNEPEPVYLDDLIITDAE